jgi:hypothetical protein
MLDTLGKVPVPHTFLCRQELTRPPLDYLKAVADIPEDLAIAFKVGDWHA